MKMYDERARIYGEAIHHYGNSKQCLVAIEEMSELIKELCKNDRGNENWTNVAEEIADVTIMIEQLRLIFDCNDYVNEVMDFKLRRLKERLEAEQ